ncbi:MAG TPA: ABC transporter permease [Sporichthyaceae bacterium]|jgi:peptide/nickel transport system permease protein|nr:ABC transporter permease [Sporichthyaceae bacterium]
MSMPPTLIVATAPPAGEPPGAVVPGAPGPTRSPAQIAWIRFRRDRVGVVSAWIVVFFLAVALLAPVIGWIYGRNPYTTYGVNEGGLLTPSGLPAHRFGGMSSSFWLGVEPGLGRDVFMQLVYGARTSLFIAFVVSVITTVFGVLFGIVIGYLGGKVDWLGGRIIDIALTFPGLLLLIALSPIIETKFSSPDEELATWKRFAVVIIVLSILGWMGSARLIRGQVLSLREREFVDAARMSGASTWRIVTKELLPNLWSPIMIMLSLSIPGVITGEAGLSFLGVGILEPIPDWGRMVKDGADVYFADPIYLIVPGTALLILVIAFNLLGDSLRDALDPKGVK